MTNVTYVLVTCLTRNVPGTNGGSELLDLLATFKIDIRPGRRFERDTQKRRAASRAKKLQALEAKKHAA